MSPVVLGVLTVTGGVAGFVDAIAGGGGLLTLPVLLASGVAPLPALAINKLQSACGTATASLAYRRGGHVQLRELLPALAMAFTGSLAGVGVVQHIGTAWLAAVMPVLLILLCLYFAMIPARATADRAPAVSWRAYAAAACGVGFYDGFFGPGAGAFYAASLMSLRGLGLLRATAHTKPLNLTSNAAALLVLVGGGAMRWDIGLCMAAANAAGSQIGSHTAMRWGGRLIRPLLIATCAAMSVKLLLAPDNPVGGLLRAWL